MIKNGSKLSKYFEIEFEMIINCPKLSFHLVYPRKMIIDPKSGVIKLTATRWVKKSILNFNPAYE